MKPASSVDLHMHSCFSDGTWSPEALVEHAIENAIDVISLTDHDTLSGLEPARIHLEKLFSNRPVLIDGVEVSVRHQSKDFHLLAYFPDGAFTGSVEEMGSVLEHNRNVRHQFALRLVDVMRREGFPLTMEAILKEADGGTIGKAHMTKAIIACGIASDIEEAYNRFFGSAREQPYRIPRDWIGLEEAVAAILKKSGIPVIAHPGYEGKATEELLLSLKALGVMGVEVYHSYHSQGDRDSLLKTAARCGLLVTGGSDCHGPWQGSTPYMGSQNLKLNLFSDFFSALEDRRSQPIS